MSRVIARWMVSLGEEPHGWPLRKAGASRKKLRFWESFRGRVVVVDGGGERDRRPMRSKKWFKLRKAILPALMDGEGRCMIKN